MFQALKVVQKKVIYVCKKDFYWNRVSSLFKKRFDTKNQFCTDKGKEIQSCATPTRNEVYVGTVIVRNSVSNEFGVKATRSSSTLLAKTLAKTDVVRKTVSKREKMVEST